jgi:hypothetical protein
LYDNGYAYYSAAPLHLNPEETPEGTSYDEVMAAVDREYPLPSPPLRAGQVWLLEARQAVTTALLNTTMHKFLRTTEAEVRAGLRVPGLLPEDTLYGVEAFAESEARRRAHRAEDQHATMGFNPYEYGGYLLGDQFLMGPDAERLLLRNDPLIKAYLIADPADAKFVVWTGAKEGTW